MNNQRKFNQIAKDIRSVKIQGARNVARAALQAYSLIPTAKSKKILLSLRPTEPMMKNVLDLAEQKIPCKEIANHFDFSQQKINESIFKLIKNGDVIFTHCHSTNVVNSLIYSKKPEKFSNEKISGQRKSFGFSRKGKKFEVVNTETRPLFQGRKTATQLRKAGIKITQYIDSAALIAITKGSGDKQVDKIFLGADALLKNGIINKIGSGMLSQLAYDNKIPVFIVADSWKFTKQKVPIENRKLNEVWDKAPKGIKIKNPAFEFVDKKYISGIVTEFGLMSYGEFVRKISKIENNL